MNKQNNITLEAPKTIDELHQRLLTLTPDLPKRLKQCADYVIRAQNRIAISTITESAVECNVPASAFVRFCQTLGFSGYSELQKLLRMSLSNEWPDYGKRLEKLLDTDYEKSAFFLAEFADAGRKSLENLIKTVDQDLMDRVVSILAKGDIIHIAGFRRSFPAAAYLYYYFEKMNIPALLHDNAGALGAHQTIRKNDVFLAITYNPSAQPVIDLIEKAYQNGAKIVAISDAVNPQLHRFSPIIMPVREAEYDSFRTLTATMTLAISLAVATAAARKQQKAKPQKKEPTPIQ